MLSCGHVRNKLEVVGTGLVVSPSAEEGVSSRRGLHSQVGPLQQKALAGTPAEGTLYPEKSTVIQLLREAS